MTGILSFLGACSLLVLYDIFLRDKVIKKGKEFFRVEEEHKPEE